MCGSSHPISTDDCLLDSVEDFHKEAKMLVDAMLEANALELLVQRLLSLDEKVLTALNSGSK